MSLLASHWSASWPVLAVYAVIAGAHLLGLIRLRMVIKGEAVAFHAGLLVALLALVSPVGYWAGLFIWVRAIQDLALAVVAPGLIVLGAPWEALGRCLGRRPGGAARSTAWWQRWPVGAVLAFNVIWLAWHLPALFDQVAASPAAAAAEHLLYLGAGVLFWLQLIGSRPWTPAATPMRRATFLVGTVAADTVLGMVLVFGSGVLYPAYANAGHHIMTVVDDQQLAGAILWMGMLPPMIIATLAVLMRWFSDEESQALSAGMDRLLTQRSSPWPSRPRFR
jgi:putative membrane protein